MSRKHYIVLALILLSLEILIGAFMHDRIIRPHGGDMLVVILIYCIIRTIKPHGIRFLPLYVFLFAVFVEVMQYLRITGYFASNEVMRIAVGATFDWLDIIAYALGTLIIIGTRYILKRKGMIQAGE